MKSLTSSPTRRSSSSSRSYKTKETNTRFIPNLSQLKKATSELPDAELWPDDTCLAPINVDGLQRTIEFSRKQINRGNTKTYRWIYDGKILIRNRDIPGSDN